MGLATIDPRSHKVQTKFTKSLSLVEIDPKVSMQIQPFENVKFYKELYGPSGRSELSEHSVRMAILARIHFFVNLTFLNDCISVKTSLINKYQTWVFCESIVAYSIIYRPVPSPLWFEIRL